MKRGVAIAGCIATAALFALLRLYLTFVRDPDHDEFFTVWISRKDLAALFETLRVDTAPPLYYAIASIFPPTLTGTRMVSVLAAAAALALVMRAAGGWTAALGAGLLLAVYPQHVYFSSVARMYALVALLVGIAAVALDRWAEHAERRALAIACIAIVAAAHSHYYGLYFFPLPFAVALFTRRDLLRDGAVATALIAVAFLPGFLLMSAQPTHGVAWMRIEDGLTRVWMVAQSVLRVGFDGRQLLPFAMTPSATTAIRVISALVLLGALLVMRKSPRASRYLLAVLVPIAGAIFAAAIGVTAYFPLRFEVVLSVPVVLWFWFAADAADGTGKKVLVATACGLALISCASLVTRDWRNTTPFYRAALFARDRVAPEVPIVATGTTYLQTAVVADRPIIAFPKRDEVHPWSDTPEAELQREVASLPRAFLWIGETNTPEFRVISSRHQVQPAARFGQVVVAGCVR